MNSCPWITLSDSDTEKFFQELGGVLASTDFNDALKFLVRWFVASSSSRVFEEIETEVHGRKFGGLANYLCCSFSKEWVVINLSDSHFDKILEFVSCVEYFASLSVEQLDDYEHGFLELNDEQVFQYRLWEHIKVTFSCFEKSILSLIDIPKASICRGLFKLGRDYDWGISSLLKKQVGLENSLLVKNEHEKYKKRLEEEEGIVEKNDIKEAYEDKFNYIMKSQDFFCSEKNKKYFIFIDRDKHFYLFQGSSELKTINIANISDSEFDLILNLEDDNLNAVLILQKDYISLLWNHAGKTTGFKNALNNLKCLEEMNTKTKSHPLITFEKKNFSFSEISFGTTQIVKFFLFLILNYRPGLDNKHRILSQSDLDTIKGNDKINFSNRRKTFNSDYTKGEEVILGLNSPGRAENTMSINSEAKFLILSLELPKPL